MLPHTTHIQYSEFLMSVYRVLCTVFRVLCTVYRVLCIVYCVLCTVYRLIYNSVLQILLQVKFSSLFCKKL